MQGGMDYRRLFFFFFFFVVGVGNQRGTGNVEAEVAMVAEIVEAGFEIPAGVAREGSSPVMAMEREREGRMLGMEGVIGDLRRQISAVLMGDE